MAFSRGPFTLVLNVAQSLLNPTATGGNPAVGIQIQNSSGFVISVLAGGEQYTIQSFTAQVVPLIADGSPVTVDAVQSTGTTANKLTVVWLLAGESPPMTTGPLTAAAIVAAITGTVSLAPGTTVGVTKITDPVTLTGTVNVQGVAGGTTIGVAGTITTSATSVIESITNATSVVNETNTILQTGDRLDYLGQILRTPTHTSQFKPTGYSPVKNYSAILLVVTTNSATNRMLYGQVALQTGGINFLPQFRAAMAPSSTGLQRWQAIIPCGNGTGQQIDVFAFATTALGALAKCTVFGLTSSQSPFRSDGRGYPLGARLGFAATSGVTVATVVAAPASPLRILLKTAQICAFRPAAAGFTTLIGTISGTSVAILSAFNSPSASSPSLSFEGGLLLDSAKGLTISGNQATSSALATVTYDLVA
jgi:hypothetical protein